MTHRDSRTPHLRRAKRPERARTNLPPHRGFARPADILEAPLAPADKLRLLQEWEQDLRGLLVATDENMPAAPPGPTGRTGDLLRDARRAIAALRRAAADDGSSGNASGAASGVGRPSRR